MENGNKQHTSRDRWLRTTVLLMVIQYALILMQRIQIILFDTHIAPHLPTMAEPEKSNWVSLQFGWLAIGLPFLAQFILMPTIFWTSNNTKLTNKQKWLVCITTVLLALFSMYQSWDCIGLTIGAFD